MNVNIVKNYANYFELELLLATTTDSHESLKRIDETIDDVINHYKPDDESLIKLQIIKKQFLLFEDLILQDLAMDHETLDFYFKVQFPDNASLFSLIYNNHEDPLMSPNSNKYALVANNIFSRINACLDNDEYKDYTHADLIDYLDTIDELTTQSKWLLIKTLSKIDYHFKFLDELYKKFKTSYHKHLPVIDSLLIDLFAELLSDCAELTPEQINKRFVLGADKNYSIHFSPLLYNTIGIIDDGIIIGCLANSFINQSGKYESDTKGVLEFLECASETSKFEILILLTKGEYAGNQIAKHLNLTPATISHHMKQLLNAQLVYSKKSGNKLIYFINKDHITHYLNSLMKMFGND